MIPIAFCNQVSQYGTAEIDSRAHTLPVDVAGELVEVVVDQEHVIQLLGEGNCSLSAGTLVTVHLNQQPHLGNTAARTMWGVREMVFLLVPPGTPHPSRRLRGAGSKHRSAGFRHPLVSRPEWLPEETPEGKQQFPGLRREVWGASGER